MHAFTVFVSFLLAITGLAVASPILEDRQLMMPPAKYFLQTRVYGNHKDCGTNKTNLWVYSYHTGAGTGDVGLSADKKSAMQAYINGTEQLFTYPGNTIGGWPLAIVYGPYQRFSLATISIAAERPGYQGFYFNSTGLQYNNSVSGWIACDWWHGVPQLFNVDGYNSGPIPNTCSRVRLLPVAI